ncbi:MAG TPA: hypothetical protein VD971_04950 [Phycisphaerales bacterium]|nr:hypothetical protein [Phycisphaerales bacterium]
MLSKTTAAGVVGIGLVAVLAGCQQPPRGNTGGRIDPVRTTPAEMGDPRVLPTALFEFSDQVAQQLAADLKDVPELSGEYRATVVFGDIANKTGIVPTSDFEAFLKRTRQSLMQSRNVLRNVRFVENKARVDQLIRRESSSSQDLLQEGRRTERADLNPDHTYFLNGEMYRVERGGSAVNLYMLSCNLVRMSDGEIVWTNSPYEIKQGVR